VSTLPHDDPPKAVVILGILTEQLEPVDQDTTDHIQTAKSKFSDVPSVESSEHTRKAVLWLLNEVREDLNPDRKRIIGRLLSQTELHPINQPSQPETGQGSDPDSPEENTSARTSANSTESADKPDSTAINDVSTQKSVEKDNTLANNDQKDRNKQTETTTDVGFTCEFCSTVVESKSDLMSHSAYCDERPTSASFRCEYCGNKYSSKRALSNHLNGCDGIDKTTSYTCSNCGKEFNSNGKLLKHRHSCDGSQKASHTHSESKRSKIAQDVRGTVVHYDTAGGYGFINCTEVNNENMCIDKSEDVFFHISKHPHESASENQRLCFDIKQGDEGPKAVNISHVDQPQVESRDETFASERSRWGKDS